MTTTIRLVCASRGETVDSCNPGRWEVMAGKLDWSKIANSTHFIVVVEHGDGKPCELANVYVGRGEHIAEMSQGERLGVIPAEAIIPTVRLFVSCCVRRDKLFAPPTLIIQPE